MVLAVHGVGAEKLRRLLRRHQHGAQIHALRLPMIHRGVRIQRIHPADHLVDRAEAQPRHDLAQLLGHHEEVVDDMLRLALELAPQRRVLGGDAHRAGVQVALAHHDAAEGDERRGGEAELLGAQQAGDGDVPPGLELAVRLQHHPGAQVVDHQGLVGFGDAQFPRQPGVLDGGQRRGAGAAGVPGDDQMVGPGLDHPGRHRAHPHLRAQLDADAGVRVAVLQVVNELGDVLDGVDVVVRRRADQAHPRRGVADAGDHLIDLVAGQFAALPRLGALHDLDLQLIGVGEVMDGHAEAPAGHLLDGAALGVPVGQGRKAARVLAALASVGLAADAVHGDGQGLVGFGADGAEAHGAGGEAAQDCALRLHFVQVQGFGDGLEVQQAAQGGAGRSLRVGVLREAPIGRFVIAAGGHLQVGDGLGVPHVGVPVPPPVEVPRVGQHGHLAAAVRVAQAVAALHFLRQHLKAHPLHPAGGAAEGPFDHLVR